MNLQGTYKGFSSTSESGIGLGEFEVIFTDETIERRFATGKEVWEYTFPRSALREMTKEEIATIFLPEASLNGIGTYALGANGPFFIMLLHDQTTTGNHFIRVLRPYGSDISDMLAPTFLFSPEDVAAGHYEEHLNYIEAIAGDVGIIPRLNNGGIRLPQATI